MDAMNSGRCVGLFRPASFCTALVDAVDDGEGKRSAAGNAAFGDVARLGLSRSVTAGMLRWPNERDCEVSRGEAVGNWSTGAKRCAMGGAIVGARVATGIPPTGTEHDPNGVNGGVMGGVAGGVRGGDSVAIGGDSVAIREWH